jgi:hypothetical protein
MTDPLKHPIKRGNKLPLGNTLHGILTYSDGTSDDLRSLEFRNGGDVEWSSRGDDQYVLRRPFKGKWKMDGDKVKMTFETKTGEHVEEEATFKAEFDGVLRDGCLIVGTFKKSRASTPMTKDGMSTIVHSAKTTIKHGREGTFWAIVADPE